MASVYRDREQAGCRLAEELAGERVSVVVGIPRGGVIVAHPIALRLGRPLTVVQTCKLTSPRAPELAFGAVDSEGQHVLDRATVHELDLDQAEIDEVCCRVFARLHRRQVAYHALPLDPPLLAGGALVVDDGLATGLTMRCAVRLLRRRGAPRVVVAAPCGSSTAVRQLRAEADDVVCPLVSDSFYAVGAYYDDFEPVPEEREARLLSPVPERSPNPLRHQGEPLARGR